MAKTGKIAVIDLKCFYAFVECVERGLNPMTTPLVVCDTSRGEGTIILSVSPYLKSQGIPSRLRKRDLPKIEGMVYATPRMQLYIDKSCEVNNIILDFIGEDDMHIYSIDEVFINLEPYLFLYGKTPYQMVRMIQKKIYEKTKLVTAAGISYNMFLAKAALDLDAKKRAPYITEWKEKDVKGKLWKVTPLSKVWGISSAYERRLNAIGIYTVEDLAKAPKELLKSKFGILGIQLWEHANGIDNTNIREKYVPENTSLSVGQVLFRDYTFKEVPLIIKEMNDDLMQRLRKHHALAKTVYLGIGYSLDDYGGFHRRKTFDIATNNASFIYNELMTIYKENIQDRPIRRVHIGVSSFEDDAYKQTSIFGDINSDEEDEKLMETLDELKDKYGRNIITRGSALLKESTAKERHNQIGGHKR